MSSINQLVSEIAHSVQQPDSVPVRRAIKLGLVHARSELIRKTYSNHNYTDNVLKQRFTLALEFVNDGDVTDNDNELGLKKIKRTTNKVPTPVRLVNNLPFHSVRTLGSVNPLNIPNISEGSSHFYSYLPGMDKTPSYAYINNYIYIYNLNSSISNIIVEGVFEYPRDITTLDNIDDDDEFFLPEDLVNAAKKMVLETFNPNVVRETNEIPTANLVK